MLLYLAVFSICLLIAQIADNYKQHKIYWGFLGILVLFLSYFSGVRDLQVGIDTQIYIPSYWSESNAQNFTRFLKILEETEKDKGFLALDFVAHAFGGELWISLFFISLFIYGVAFIAGGLFAKEYKFNFTYFVFFYLFVFFNTTMNHMRQQCAVSLIMLTLYLLMKRHYIFSLLIFLLSTTFHSSAIVAVGIPIIYFINYSARARKSKNVITILIFLIILISIQYYYQIATFLSANDIIYEVYADRYGKDSEYEGSSFISIPKIIYLFMPFLFYLNGKNRGSLNQKDFTFFSSIQILFLVTYSLKFISIFLFRLAYYYQFIQFIACSKIITDKRSEKVWNVIYMGYIVLLWYYEYIFHGYHGTYPYTSRILGL
jgi:hypothetical protein